MKKFVRVLCLVLALTSVFSLCACNGNNEQEGDYTTLIMYTQATIQSGMEEMIDAVNDYLIEKMNVKLDLRLSGAYSSTMSTKIDAREQWDICLVGTGVDFNSYAKRNAFAPITDYIDQMPLTTAQLIEGGLESFTLDGEIYAIPVLKDMFERYDLVANQTMLDELGVEFPEYATKMDLVDFFYELKEAKDEMYPEDEDIPLLKDVFYNYDHWFVSERLVGGFNLPLVDVNISEEHGYANIDLDDTCFCPVYTPEFRKLMKLIRQLVEDGIGHYDPKSWDGDNAHLYAGKLLGEFGSGLISVPEDYLPGFKNKLYSSSVVYADEYRYGFAINAACQNVELAVQVLELLQNDPYLATTLHFGKEGSGWTDKDNNGVIELTDANKDARNRLWYQWYGWPLGGVTAMKVLPGNSPDYMDQLKALNKSAQPKPNRGFKFDPENVANEMAAVSNVFNEYYSDLSIGRATNVDRKVDEFIRELKANGMDKIVEECQRQLDAWRAANGK